MIEYNPLDVLKKRSLQTMPPHFGKIKVADFSLVDDELESWIRTKLKGRYAVTQLPTVGNDGKLKSAMFAGFEDQKELTYFMLACPYLRRN
jgi:hypothetical protein